MNSSKRKDKRITTQSRIIERQTDEIESLKNKVSSLEVSCDEKDEIINSIDSLREDMRNVIEDIKNKGEVYDKLIEELTEMKKVMNEEVFKGKWKLVRFLIR